MSHGPQIAFDAEAFGAFGANDAFTLRRRRRPPFMSLPHVLSTPLPLFSRLILASCACAAAPATTYTCSPLVPTTWRVVQRVTRDGGCFTQGLYFTPSGSLLVESCGIYGASRVRTVSLENGSYVETARAKNNASDFGEGATQWPPTAAQGASILQLTWQERAVVVWDAATLQVTARVPFILS